MNKGDWLHRVLIFAPSVDGGIPHYTHYQASELAARGVETTVLCHREHPWFGKAEGYHQTGALTMAPRGKTVWHKALSVLNHVWIHYILLWQIVRLRPSAVVFEANTEFYGALWAWPHLLLSFCGLPYVMTLHDPVRGLWYGPVWFDRLSRWAAYRLLWGGLVHGDPPDGAFLPPWLMVESVPHGLFGHMGAAPPPYDLRERLGIAGDAFVLLSFGHIADRKNQHLLVEAVARVPEAVLVIAGPQMSRRNRPPEFYRSLATELGCGNRVHVIDRFIPDDEAGALFSACNAVALTYESQFVSQSGVIQIAAQWDRPVLASSGPGPLRAAVESAGIGLFVAPDSAGAIEAGLRALIADKSDRREAFAAYRRTASWTANVDGLLRLLRRVTKR